VLSSENFGCWDKLGCFLTGLTEEKEDSAILDLEGLMTSTWRCACCFLCKTTLSSSDSCLFSLELPEALLPDPIKPLYPEFGPPCASPARGSVSLFLRLFPLLDEDLTFVQAPPVDDPFKITEGTESDEQVDELSSTKEVRFPAWSFCTSPLLGTVA
jgi:hypothetical protein